MKIGFIAQRWGGSTPEDSYPQLVEFFKEYLIPGASELHLSTGVGADVAALDAVIQAGNVSIYLYEPFPNHTEFWPNFWRSRYKTLSNSGSARKIVTAAQYYPGVYDQRNEQLLRSVDTAIVLWDGSVDRGMGRLLASLSRRGSPEQITNLAQRWLK